MELIEFKYETINSIVQELNNYKNPPSIVIPGRTFKDEILIYLSIEFASRGVRIDKNYINVRNFLRYHGLGEWFMDLLYETNSIIAGGFMLNVIVKILNANNKILPPYGDIDIFMTNITNIIYFEKAFNEREIEYEAIRTENSITIKLKSRKMIGTIQFILGRVEVFSLLNTFDIPISGIMFYRNKIFVTRETIFELMYGIHANTQKNTINYLNRLVKYSSGYRENKGKGIKILFPYYIPINTNLTKYSFNDFWSIYTSNRIVNSSYEYGNNYNFRILKNILSMGSSSILSTRSFCLDGKSYISPKHIYEDNINEDLIDYIEKLYIKLKILNTQDIGKVDWTKTIYDIKNKTNIEADMYNGNDLRLKLNHYPRVISNIIMDYIGDTIVIL